MSDPGGVDPSPPTAHVALASLPRRLAAIVYDALLLLGVLIGATALMLGLTVAVVGGAAVKAAVSSLRSDDIDFSAEDTAELLATVEESVDQLTALVDNLLDSSRLAAGVVRPELKRVYLEEAVQRALRGTGRDDGCGLGHGRTQARSRMRR